MKPIHTAKGQSRSVNSSFELADIQNVLFLQNQDSLGTEHNLKIGSRCTTIQKSPSLDPHVTALVNRVIAFTLSAQNRKRRPAGQVWVPRVSSFHHPRDSVGQ